MTKGELIEMLAKFAKEYAPDALASVRRNTHMNNLRNTTDEVTQDVADALIVDFINFIGRKQGIDVGMYTVDLKVVEAK
jgi:hypothetical protein